MFCCVFDLLHVAMEKFEYQWFQGTGQSIVEALNVVCSGQSAALLLLYLQKHLLPGRGVCVCVCVGVCV